VDVGRAREVGLKVLLDQLVDGVEKVWLEDSAVLVSEGKMYVRDGVVIGSNTAILRHKDVKKLS